MLTHRYIVPGNRGVVLPKQGTVQPFPLKSKNYHFVQGRMIPLELHLGTCFAPYQQCIVLKILRRWPHCQCNFRHCSEVSISLLGWTWRLVKWSFSCCNKKLTIVVFYFRGQLLHHISIVANVGIVNVQSLSFLAFTVFLWLAGIPFFLYFLSYGLIQLYFLTSGRKHIMIFKGTAVILCCIGWLLKILLTGRKVISVKGKKLSAWGLFQLLFCTASRKKIPFLAWLKKEYIMKEKCQ